MPRIHVRSEKWIAIFHILIHTASQPKCSWQYFAKHFCRESICVFNISCLTQKCTPNEPFEFWLLTRNITHWYPCDTLSVTRQIVSRQNRRRAAARSDIKTKQNKWRTVVRRFDVTAISNFALWEKIYHETPGISYRFLPSCNGI